MKFFRRKASGLPCPAGPIPPGRTRETKNKAHRPVTAFRGLRPGRARRGTPAAPGGGKEVYAQRNHHALLRSGYGVPDTGTTDRSRTCSPRFWRPPLCIELPPHTKRAAGVSIRGSTSTVYLACNRNFKELFRDFRVKFPSHPPSGGAVLPPIAG